MAATNISGDSQLVEPVTAALSGVEPSAGMASGSEREVSLPAESLPVVSQTAESRPRVTRYFPLVAFLLILASVAAIRYRFLETPLERDEGEFAYGGQLILAGERPYTSMYAMKLPGIYLAYALIEAVFGQTIFAVHFGLLLVNLACIALVFVLGSKMVNGATGAVAAAIFAIMSFSPAVVGSQAQAEHFVIFFALLGMCCLLSQNRRFEPLYCFFGGLAFGSAFLCKQHGFVFPLFGLAYLALREPASWKISPGRLIGDLSAMLLGCLLPWMICCAVFLATGTLGDFIFWTFTYPTEYVSLVSPEKQLWRAVPAIVHQLKHVGAFWIAAIVGLSALYWYGAVRRWRTCLLLLLFCCFLGVMPGGYYREHYFVFLAAPIALLAAIGWGSLAKAYRAQGGGRLLPLVLLLMIFCWPVWKLASFYAPLNAESLSAALYSGCPFREAVVFSRYLEDHTSPEDRIAILGSEPEVLFYSKRRSATGHIYMYPLMEPHPYALRLQQQLIDEVEAAKPKFIVYFSHPNSWISKPGADAKHFQKWMDSFLTEHYFTTGIAEMTPGKTTYHWGDEVNQLDAISPTSIVIHQRR